MSVGPFELNSIVCGDCLEVLPQLPDEIFDLAICDPPYDLGFWDWVEGWVELVYSKLKEDSSIYIFCGIGERSDSLSRILPIIKRLFKFKNLITWKKQRGYGTQRNWMYTREEIIFAIKGKHYFQVQYSDELRPHYTYGFLGRLASKYKPLSEYKRVSNVWTDIQEITPGVGNKPEWTKHPTQKPEALIERIIKASSKEGDLVLDPFIGSGTTAVVARRLGRNYFGCDISKEYVEMANARLKGGSKAVREIRASSKQLSLLEI